MNKWGVRLIAVYLFIWAISDFYKLIASNEKIVGFLGFDLGLAHNGNPIDVMGWVESVVLLYAGVQLLRFKPSGRYWALFIFGSLSLFSGFYIIVIVAVWINSYFTLTEFPFTISFPGSAWLGEIGSSIIAVAAIAGIFLLLFFLPTYFLMRQDVKTLFEEPQTVKPTAQPLE